MKNTAKETVDNNKLKKICICPEHNPPSHMVFQAGTHEHVCPACGHKTIFYVPEITY